MSEDLQSLLEKINREGVEKAKSEAEKIVSEAKASAAAIVKAANDEAAKAKADAQKASEDYAARAAETVRPVLVDDSPILIEKRRQAGITRQVELEEGLTAPVEKGQVVGRLRILAGDQLLKELPLTAAEDVPRLTFGEIWLRVLRDFCLGGA